MQPLPRTLAGTAATLGLAIATSLAVLATLESSTTHPLACIDPLSCSAPEEADFFTGWTSSLRSSRELQEESFRALAHVGVALTLMFLSIAAINLATRLTARSAARRSELAIHAMLGASPLRLLRWVAGEAFHIIVTALPVAAVTAAVLALLLRTSWPLGAPPWSGGSAIGSLNRAASVLLLLVVAASVVWPATVGWARDLRRFLTVGARATPPPTEGLVRDGLVILQIAASLVLLVGSALLMAGFRPAAGPVADARSAKPSTAIADLRLPVDALSPSALVDVLERVRAVPGVEDTSLTSVGASLGRGVTDRVTALCPECHIGSLPKQQTSGTSHVRAVSADFFSTLELALRGGRAFTDGDDVAAPLAAVVSRAFSVRFFPGGDPVGKEIRIGDLPGTWYRVVGIVEDLPGRGLGSAAAADPVLYLSVLQQPPTRSQLLVRTSDAAAEESVLATAAVAVTEALPTARLGDWTSLERLVQRQRAPLRWFGSLFAALAIGATLFAAAGLYGLLASSVGRRRREIGVRMALGADERMIVWMVVRKSIKLVATGLVVGLIPLSGLARLLQLRYEGVDPWNPWIALGVVGMLLCVAIAASIRPARQAAHCEPVVSMRG